jgi:uncharacterized protein (TIRG00374 family)
MDGVPGEVRATVAGFVAALVVLVALFWLVGIEEMLAALVLADRAALVAVVGVALAWLAAWGMALRTVLGVLDVPSTPGRAFLVYASATFANNVTPFGQAGGEPFSALLISRATDCEYETGLAAIASVDALNFVPSIGFALAGMAYYATVFTVGRRVEVAATTVVGLAVVVPLVAYLAWQSRDRLEAVAVRGFTPLGRRIGRFLPRIRPPDPEAVRGRIEGFFRAIERVAASRRGLATALTFSALGWLLLSLSLWTALYALGAAVPFAILLFVVPASSVAGATPLPGGLGGVETALVLLLVPTTGVSAATASAAVLIHRGATYWLPVLVGGSAAATLEAVET